MLKETPYTNKVNADGMVDTLYKQDDSKHPVCICVCGSWPEILYKYGSSSEGFWIYHYMRFTNKKCIVAEDLCIVGCDTLLGV